MATNVKQSSIITRLRRAADKVAPNRGKIVPKVSPNSAGTLLKIAREASAEADALLR